MRVCLLPRGFRPEEQVPGIVLPLFSCRDLVFVVTELGRVFVPCQAAYSSTTRIVEQQGRTLLGSFLRVIKKMQIPLESISWTSHGPA